MEKITKEEEAAENYRRKHLRWTTKDFLAGIKWRDENPVTYKDITVEWPEETPEYIKEYGIKSKIGKF